MSRWGAVLVGALGCAVLVLATLIVAHLSARSGSPPGVLASAPAAAPSPPPPSAPAAQPGCDVGATGAAGSTLQLRGACTGDLTSAFGCIAAVDDLYVTGRRQIDGAHVLYLTINVEHYHHPGDYTGAQAVLQLTGPGGVERWSNYGVGVHVGADRSVDVAVSDLRADPGTGSNGSVTVSGSIGCGA